MANIRIPYISVAVVDLETIKIIYLGVLRSTIRVNNSK